MPVFVPQSTNPQKIAYGAKLTIVVTRYNISLYPGEPPKDGATDRERRIGGQLYSREDVEALVKDPAAIRFWTPKCQRDAVKLDLDEHGAAELVREALQGGKKRPAEWCEQKPTGPWAACDAYVLRRKEWNDAARREIDCEYYLKFAISKTGKLLLMASCHLSEN